jgi:DSHCT (NUC185) domain
MVQAAKAIGNTELENKFAAAITAIKRDIVFAPSLVRILHTSKLTFSIYELGFIILYRSWVACAYSYKLHSPDIPYMKQRQESHLAC